MTARNYQDYDMACTAAAGMTLDDELLFPQVQKGSDMPTAEPLSSCSSDESTAASTTSTAAASNDAKSNNPITVTGKHADIERKYNIDYRRVLGRGHNGTVRECTDRATGRRRAVKSIRKNDRSVGPGGLSREIEILQRMEHRSIIHLVDVYEDVEYLHLVTDLCEGGELFDRIVEKSSSSSSSSSNDDADAATPCFAEEDAARIMHQILTAVSYMHKRGIVHRDLKPENILFETRDEDHSPIKIADFGLARKHCGRYEPPMNSIVGTPYYMAPEVLRRKYDKACDGWSAGIIAYVLLCGYPPFNGNTDGEIRDAIARGGYRFPSADWCGTSRDARQFIRGLLRKDPKKRMTIQEALGHPWLVRHAANNTDAAAAAEVVPVDEGRQDNNSSVEVVFEGSSERDSIFCISGIENDYGEAKEIPLFGFS